MFWIGFGVGATVCVVLYAMLVISRDWDNWD